MTGCIDLIEVIPPIQPLLPGEVLDQGNPRDTDWVKFIKIRSDATPFYDASYGVDSANLGPYGQAIVTELIPYVESNFRIIREPWARVVAGGSTGGLVALAMKVFWPDFFGGTWAWCPDGNIDYTMKMENDRERAMGTNDRSGGRAISGRLSTARSDRMATPPRSGTR